MGKRLLVLDPAPVRGGAEEYLLTIACAAAQAGWEVTAGLGLGRGIDSLRRDMTQNGIHCRGIPFTPPVGRSSVARRASYLREFMALVRLASCRRTDVALLVLPWPDQAFGSLMGLALRGTRTVVTFQLMPFPFDLSRPRRACYRWARKRRQTWIAVSDSNRQAGAASFRIPPTDFDVIYNGHALPPPPAPSTPDARQSVREELGVSPDALILLSVGRLDEQKGHRDVISALPDLITEWPSLVYIVAGDGALHSAIRDHAATCGVQDQVRLLGRRGDIDRLLRAADIFVFPSHFEGAPFALLEAMASGTPIVGSDAGVIPELLTHETHGLLFRTGDPDAVAQAIRRRLRNREEGKMLSAAAQARAKDFTQEKMVTRTMRMLREAAARS